ncbi:MAG: hypothetical protein IJJ56_12715, partial [Prevotella sp.]|nr:hypothetical protein [Prevotella sp.]
MKRYLMTGMAALVFCGVFTSCSHDTDFGGNNPQLSVQETYEEAFITRFGQPVATQDWGFGDSRASTRSGNMTGKERVAETSTGINANANEWADTADAPHGHGGWIVPDPLTEAQKELVRQYFQANPNLTYQDPHFANFFVQQVYTGGTSAPTTGNKEDNVAADGTTHYNSANMNLLTVGYNEQHINNFNAGTYSGSGLNTYEGAVNQDGSVNVLDSGYTVNEFAQHHHPDQIMLMVNIDDTGCMGYHNTGASLQKNDKAALVSWTEVRRWAREQQIYTEDILNDGWNRSFVGFDFELYSLDQSYLKDNSGNNIYAQFSDGQLNGLEYVWDGTNIIPRQSSEGGTVQDITDAFTGFWNNDDGNQSLTENADGTITYHSAVGGGLMAWYGKTFDFSPYKSVVVEFAEAPTVSTTLFFELPWGSSTQEADAGVNQIEFVIENVTDPWNLANSVSQIALQANGESDIIISRIYLTSKESESVEGYGDYLLVNGQQVPFLNTNTNMYGGIKQTITDDDMQTTQGGKTCFDMAKIAQLVGDGYLPVKNTNLRDWVKWQGGDGYYSDWIVTL